MIANSDWPNVKIRPRDPWIAHGIDQGILLSQVSTTPTLVIDTLPLYTPPDPPMNRHERRAANAQRKKKLR